MQTKNDKIWQGRWGYRESAAITIGLIVIGFILQLTVGGFNFYLLSSPVNIILAAIITMKSIVLGLRYKKSSYSQWVSGVELSVTLILALLLLTIIMGLTLQVSNEAHSVSSLGFDMMTSSWVFILIYSMTILSLGTLITRRICNFKAKRDIPFLLNHFGLWLFLLSSGLGYADMERYIMHVMERETEWRVYDSERNMKELPIAIELNDFDMDIYPPKIAMINRTTGDIQPNGRPEYYQIDTDSRVGVINGWKIELEKYIHEAVRSADSTYKEVPMPGSTPAALVTMTKGDEIRKGWVCGGNQSQLYMTLPLNDDYCMVMTEPEPRSFVSDVVVYTEDGTIEESIIKVNSPLQIGSWTIYQYGYDNAAGRLSAYSSFELVYDKWLAPVYIGIILMMIGSVLMVWNGKREKGVKNDLE